ncbi:ABC transporter substrate-binding protein [Salinarimonas ramus]|uniref:ABC transporter substrate-binding protein n=1 Tax=Salinarimonas ramus TaxID=690164 RepID=A0A917QI44_9HYPH|nr:ABC transporter substrate-binding protein [Salinarimonas ramus]GGK51863.1 ABC transporter substrate-binding protein [Salinarimonas ramus]
MTFALATLTRRSLVAAFAAGVALAGLATAPAVAQDGLTPVRFSLDWRFEGPSAPFLAALEKGYFEEEGLDVTIDAGAGSVESINRVASGPYDMAFGDFNSLIRYRSSPDSVPVKAVAMVYNKPAFAIVGRASRGITEDLESLRGKTFGAPEADAAYAQWPIFKDVNDIDEAAWEMTFENVGFPVREPMLAQGEVDAVFGFAMSSAINLAARGVPMEDIVVLNMGDYGVELYGNVIMAKPEFMEENPEAVAGFLRAFIRGLEDTIANPTEGAGYVVQYNDVARQEVEADRWQMTIDNNILTEEVAANGFGDIDAERYERALEQIDLTFDFQNRPALDDVFTSEFLPPMEERMLQ